MFSFIRVSMFIVHNLAYIQLTTRGAAQNIVMHHKYLNNKLRTFVKFWDQSIYVLFRPAPLEKNLIFYVY